MNRYNVQTFFLGDKLKDSNSMVFTTIRIHLMESRQDVFIPMKDGINEVHPKLLEDAREHIVQELSRKIAFNMKWTVLDTINKKDKILQGSILLGDTEENFRKNMVWQENIISNQIKLLSAKDKIIQDLNQRLLEGGIGLTLLLLEFFILMSLS